MADTQVKARLSIVRFRTWTLTATILALLILYIFVTLSIKSRIEWIDFGLTAAMQISTHFAYFPDGERYGEMDALFIEARTAYNTNAGRILSESTVGDLRDFCKEEYEERKQRYIADACAKIGITIDEYKVISQKTKEEINKATEIEVDGKKVYLTKERKKQLVKIIYGKNPVVANSPDTILSAIDRDYTQAIKDSSRTYRKTVHATRLFRSIIIGAVLAYIGYNMRNGIHFSAVIKSCAFIGSMIITATSSYIAGERSSKEYRKRFYIELSVFIDTFFSWVKSKKQA